MMTGAFKYAAIALVGLVLTGELVARFGLGLGTPPLVIADDRIEYMFAPNQDVYRFHNRQTYNEYGMRSPALSEVVQPRRVAVFGDSVLNGGNQTDQAELATSIATDDATFYGNISAGSWGPANMAAWLETYGLFGADTVIVVLSSHDVADLPKFEPLNHRTHPTHAPVSALAEGVDRYLLPRLARLVSVKIEADERPPAAGADIGEEALRNGTAALSGFIDLVARNGARLCAIQREARHELRGTVEQGHDVIASIFTDRGVPVLQLAPALADLLDAGISPYRDDIHINAAGQAALVPLLRTCAEQASLPNKGHSS